MYIFILHSHLINHKPNKMNKVFYTICFFVVSNQIFSQTQLGSDIDGDAGDALGLPSDCTMKILPTKRAFITTYQIQSKVSQEMTTYISRCCWSSETAGSYLWSIRKDLPLKRNGMPRSNVLADCQLKHLSGITYRDVNESMQKLVKKLLIKITGKVK